MYTVQWKSQCPCFMLSYPEVWYLCYFSLQCRLFYVSYWWVLYSTHMWSSGGMWYFFGLFHSLGSRLIKEGCSSQSRMLLDELARAACSAYIKVCHRLGTCLSAVCERQLFLLLEWFSILYFQRDFPVYYGSCGHTEVTVCSMLSTRWAIQKHNLWNKKSMYLFLSSMHE